MIIGRKRMWNLVATGSAIAAGVAMRRTLFAGWKVVAREEPPINPADRATPWRQAILWTALTGAAVGVTRMLARRGAAAGWRRWVGPKPAGG